ncbi:MAG: nitrous oxide reductase family maturation protein NosD [Dehalococcoidia bacterium]
MKLANIIPLIIPTFLLVVLIGLLAVTTAGTPTVEATNVIHVAVGESIQGAVDSAVAGDVIQVAPGTFSQSVLIDGKSDLQLRGANTLLQGSQVGIGLNIVDSDHILVQGLTVDGFEIGIVLENTYHSRIHNVETRNNDDPTHLRPEASNHNGLDLIGSHNNLITNVFSHHNGHNGITLKGGSTNNTLRGNITNDNGVNPDVTLGGPRGCGIQLNRDGNHNNIITANESLRNAFGILLSGRNSSNPNPPGADDNTITQNRVHDNGRSGIDVRDKSSGNFIGQNNATGNAFLPNGTFDLRDQGSLDNTWKNNQGNSNF